MLYIALGQPMLTLSIERDLLSWSLGMVMPVMNYAPQVIIFGAIIFFGILAFYFISSVSPDAVTKGTEHPVDESTVEGRN